jgi:hypothetical protein
LFYGIILKVGNENRNNFIETIVGHPIVHEGNNIIPRDSFKILERLFLKHILTEYNSVVYAFILVFIISLELCE